MRRVVDAVSMQQNAIAVVQGELVEDDALATAKVDIVTRQGEAVVGKYDDTIELRPGTLRDLPWVDALQKQQSRELGFLQMKALEGKVQLGQVLVATVMDRPAGYLIASDRYMKRDELGLITQVNVEAKYRRSLVAARLVQGQFDRSAYGCRLYAAWCAQDLEANRFWEAMGFVAIAFRTGAYGKAEGGGPRVHLFWQKRIRPGDTVTSWWYPSKTEGGQMRADRIALPIPPGVHWSEVEAVRVPEIEVAQKPEEKDWETDTEDEAVAEAQSRDRVVWPRGIEDRDGVPYRRGKRLATVEMLVKEQGAGNSGMWRVPDDVQVVDEMPKPKLVRGKRKKTKAKKPKMTVDPKFVAMSRELRDRYLEEVERDPSLIAQPAARHDVTRQLERKERPSFALPESFKALPKVA